MDPVGQDLRISINSLSMFALILMIGSVVDDAVGVATFYGMLTACVVGMLFVPPLYVFFRRLAGVKG